MGEPPFRRVLIANRGEIALRVARACRDVGASPVALFGAGEENARHVRACDDAYRVDGGDSLPYLNIPAIVEIAGRAGAEAVHPGYGFLAENAGFADACGEAGIVFVGPPPAAVRAMGDKVEARRVATAAGVPVAPGSDGPVASVAAAAAWAECHGYPVAVKAAAGGGGRGFRVAGSAEQLVAAFDGSSGEASRYFANPVVYLERYFERTRHVEVQIFADRHGNVVALGERDCSVQRRHQKLIEEAPSPAVDEAARQALGQAAVTLARAVGYLGAGTVEFLFTDDGAFYFLEMNTRIQVEHTVTEEVTGIDLVKEQLLVASGRPLSFAEEDVALRGHAIQCRINAEDAGRHFAPVPGVVTRFAPPAGPGIRVDTAMEDGAEILPAYDSLVAKLVARGRDRDEAIARMRRALAEFEVQGVPTTIPFHQRVMAHPVFGAGEATTSFIAEHPEVLPPPNETAPASPEPALATREIAVEVDNRLLRVRLPAASTAGSANATARAAPRPRGGRRGGSGGPAGPQLVSPIQGTVLRVAVEAGATVERGALVCVVEAMKMENEIAAHRDGTVESIAVHPGDAVKIGTVIATIA